MSAMEDAEKYLAESIKRAAFYGTITVEVVRASHKLKTAGHTEAAEELDKAMDVVARSMALIRGPGTQ